MMNLAVTVPSFYGKIVDTDEIDTATAKIMSAIKAEGPVIGTEPRLFPEMRIAGLEKQPPAIGKIERSEMFRTD
jgi:hypothetical protein